MADSTNPKRCGVLTIAQGKQYYIDLAVNLAMSLEVHSPHLPRAVVTDSDDPRLSMWFDNIVPIDPANGVGLVQKIHVYSYSPFEETLFIDADSLVIRDISFLIDRFADHEVSVLGSTSTTLEAWGNTMSFYAENFSVSYMTLFNGGVYWYRRSKTADSVVKRAAEIAERYEEIGLALLRGQRNDEVLLSIAMSEAKCQPIPDDADTMRQPYGDYGNMSLDVLGSRLEYLSFGKPASPSILHFGFPYVFQFHYNREVLKLRAWSLGLRPNWLIVVLVNSLMNPVYFIRAMAWRVARRVFKGTRFRMHPLLPMRIRD